MIEGLDVGGDFDLDDGVAEGCEGDFAVLLLVGTFGSSDMVGWEGDNRGLEAERAERAEMVMCCEDTD